MFTLWPMALTLLRQCALQLGRLERRFETKMARSADTRRFYKFGASALARAGVLANAC